MVEFVDYTVDVCSCGSKRYSAHSEKRNSKKHAAGYLLFFKAVSILVFALLLVIFADHFARIFMQLIFWARSLERATLDRHGQIIL